MNEIEYKLNSNNSVLIVNAIDKVIDKIQFDFISASNRRGFEQENEELKFLREKCSSKDAKVSLTACQGLVALVRWRVLKIDPTMSTLVTLLPSAHNHFAILSSMSDLLILEIKSHQMPEYMCRFNLKSPQHPFITVLEKKKDAQDDVLAQMYALITHPDRSVSGNSLELLWPVFLWLTCHPQRDGGIKPWHLLLSHFYIKEDCSLLLACLSCQQIRNPARIETAFVGYRTATLAALHHDLRDQVMALMPMLARLSGQLIKLQRDPRECYKLINRCFELDWTALTPVAGITLMLLAENLIDSSALYLYDLFSLCFCIITKYKYSSISLNVFVALSLQWINLPSYLTKYSLRVATNILNRYQDEYQDDTSLHTPIMIEDVALRTLMYTDSHMSIILKLNQNWERMRNNPQKLKSWLDSIATVNDDVKLHLLPFLYGMLLEKRKESWYEEIMVKVLKIVVDLVGYKKQVAVQILPLLLYKIANEKSPRVRLECLRALPLMAKTKENVPTIVSVLNKIKINKGAPKSFLIMLYTKLAETQVRCFPLLQEILVDLGIGMQDDLKWEIDIAKAVAARRICEIRPTSHGLELVPVISSILNRCGDSSGSVATCVCVASLALLWRSAALSPPSTWTTVQPKLGRDTRHNVQISICKLLSEVPSLRVQSPEYDRLVTDAVRKLWELVAEGSQPSVVEAACDALATYKIDDYKLSDVPEIYRKTVKLPASFCKTPVDAARKPEEVLDYVPCEIWPEVFKYTHESALMGVQRLCSKLIEKELRGYRSGVYQHDTPQEPSSLAHLHPTSVARGLVECFRKQTTSPSYDFPESVLQAILETLTSEYPKPLPPFDLCFTPEVALRGTAWRRGCVRLAARQAPVSPSARRVLATYLQGGAAVTEGEPDTLFIFEILPILCRGIPPNSLRAPLERCLADSFAEISHMEGEPQGDEKEYLFNQQMNRIRQCLECDKIHDANRTLLSQIVENYFTIISDENVAWPTYVQTCCSLRSAQLERMTSPAGPQLRRSAAVRCAACAVCARPACRSALTWLNDIIDATATQPTEQEFSLRCMLPALRAVDPNAESTREWFLQLMGRTQVAFKEMEDNSAKLYLCDVFMLCVIVFSGLWCLEPKSEDLASNRRLRHALLPAAAAELIGRETWSNCTLQVLEWLCHTRTAACHEDTAKCCQRALLASRHVPEFTTHNMWIRLESYFFRNIVFEEIVIDLDEIEHLKGLHKMD